MLDYKLLMWGIDSERGLEWRCADSLSLREFLRLGEREPVPDHSWLSRTRARLPLEPGCEITLEANPNSVEAAMLTWPRPPRTPTRWRSRTASPSSTRMTTWA